MPQANKRSRRLSESVSKVEKIDASLTFDQRLNQSRVPCDTNVSRKRDGEDWMRIKAAQLLLIFLNSPKSLNTAEIALSTY